MSFISMARTGLSQLAQHERVRSVAGFLPGGAKGTMWAAGYSISAATGYYSYGKEYGAGAGLLMGIGEAAAIDAAIAGGPLGIAAGITVAGGYFAYKEGRKAYKRNRQLNLGRPMLDNYGTLNAMRMQSAQNLSRDRSGSARVLGNEARRLHR